MTLRALGTQSAQSRKRLGPKGVGMDEGEIAEGVGPR